MRTTSIHQHFADVKDPRINRTKKHPLINIIFIALCAVICGAENFASIEKFGKVRKKWFKRFLDLTQGIPSHDTFNRVLAVLEPEVFSQAFMLWVEQIVEKALTLLSQEQTSKVEVKNKRLLAGWDTDYLEKVLLKFARDVASSKLDAIALSNISPGWIGGLFVGNIFNLLMIIYNINITS